MDSVLIYIACQNYNYIRIMTLFNVFVLAIFVTSCIHYLKFPLPAVYITCSFHYLQFPLPAVSITCSFHYLQFPLPAVSVTYSFESLQLYTLLHELIIAAFSIR